MKYQHQTIKKFIEITNENSIPETYNINIRLLTIPRKLLSLM